MDTFRTKLFFRRKKTVHLRVHKDLIQTKDEFTFIKISFVFFIMSLTIEAHE